MNRAAGAWRLLEHGAADGAWNMAVDEALLAAAQAGGRPTLRLYAWHGPWLSLGYAQALEPHRAEACRGAGVGVVRRVTGGSAVLHGGDLTYAVAAAEDALPPGLEGSYALVARALREALRILGIPADAKVPAPAPGPAPFDCFARAGLEEIEVHGRKLVGSAQRRAGGAVLQHGSLRLGPDPPAAAVAAGRVEGVATSLAELGCDATEARVREAFCRGFEAVLGLPVRPGALTAPELEVARERFTLRAGKPGAPLPPVAPRFSRPPPAGR